MFTGHLCKVSKVHRSGYYVWLEKAEVHAIHEENDYQDFLLLKCIYDAFKGEIGVCGLYMALEELLEILMIHKKILRSMRKFNLISKIRRKNPYKNIAKATQEHRTVPNLLNREFIQDEPGKVFIIDINYLQMKTGQTAYLSFVKDVASHEIIAYELSVSLSMGGVYRTLRKLSEALAGNIHQEAIIHSDQGFHYTHPEYQTRVKVNQLTQSISRSGNCLDNAPIESFFGNIKDDVDY